MSSNNSKTYIINDVYYNDVLAECSEKHLKPSETTLQTPASPRRQKPHKTSKMTNTPLRAFEMRQEMRETAMQHGSLNSNQGLCGPWSAF